MTETRGKRVEDEPAGARPAGSDARSAVPAREATLTELMRLDPRVDGPPPAEPAPLPATTRRPGGRTAEPATESEAGWSFLPLVMDASRMVLVAVAFYVLFFNLSVVRGSSMTPGIQDGDRILVEPWSYVVGEVERGDVVVMRYPLDPRVDYIKRVIGLPGDRVTLANGHVWVNGDLIAEPYVDARDASSYQSLTVSPGHFFVLGDNRPRSSDSREFGLVSSELVRGRVDLRLWPLSRVGWIE